MGILRMVYLRGDSMNSPKRCPGCNRLIIVDITDSFTIDYSSNLVRSIDEYETYPDFILEHKCKYCKTMSSLWAWYKQEV